MFNRIVARQSASAFAASRTRVMASRNYSEEASSRPLGRKEKAHEDQYARHQEEIALKKLKEHLQEAKKHLAELESKVEKVEKK